MSDLSKRVSQISESLTLKLNSEAKLLQSQGIKVINLTAGEPDFTPPEEVFLEAKKVIDQKQHQYTAVSGSEKVRKKILSTFQKEHPSLPAVSSLQVLLTNGAKQALFQACLALLEEGDSAMIFSPYWLSYPEMIQFSGAETIYVRLSLQEKYRLTKERLEKELRAQKKLPKVIFFNSPSNPTGVMYSKKELNDFGSVIREVYQGKLPWVFSDEIYDRILLRDQPFCSFLNANPDWMDRLVTFQGLSKSMSMTGWRIGWAIGPKEIIQAMAKIQGQSTSGINVLAHEVVCTAIDCNTTGHDLTVQKTYQQRLILALEELTKCEKLSIVRPDGAFYLFFDVSKVLKNGQTAVHFCEDLLKEKQVALVPGEAFGEPHGVRLSFATDDQTVQEGCKKIVEFTESRTV